MPQEGVEMNEATSKKSLSAHESPLSKIFCDDYIFSIPGYQRPYSWTEEQASELVMDLLGHVQNNSNDVDDINPYFLGNIVLIKKDDKPNSEVIDGQQRLTTLTILLSVLRFLIKDKENYETNITKRICQECDPVLGTDTVYRITIRDMDKEFFKNYIQDRKGIEKLLQNKEDLNDSCMLIKNNAVCIHELLKEKSERELTDLAQFIVRKCYLVVVSTSDIDSAYRIFSVMNDRGLDLTATDILKAEIIGGIPENERQEYTGKWEAMEEQIGREHFNDLFSHIRMIHRPSKPQETLVKEFNKHVKASGQPKEFIDKKLSPCSDAYTIFLHANYSDKEKEEESKLINEKIGWLKRIDNSDWLPPAICYFSNAENDTDQLLEFVCALERLASCMMIFRGNINYRIKRYSDLLTWMQNGKLPMQYDSPINLKNDEVEKTIETLGGNIYENTKTRLMILLRLDSILSDGSAKYDHKVITVEHVLPQNPKPCSDWVRWIPKEETRKNIVHKLGNLVLLSRRKNSSASNYELKKKKESYFKVGGVSTFAITTKVISHDEWDEESINALQVEYIEKLKVEWKLVKQNS